jgi:transglutaminase-like putative cysteine protease
MRLTVRHATEYRYTEPVRESVTQVRLQPLTGALQRLENFSMDVDPPVGVFIFQDDFGNHTHQFYTPAQHQVLRIEAQSQVETTAPPPPPSGLTQADWAFYASDAVNLDDWVFTQPSVYGAVTEALEAFAAEAGLDSYREADPVTAVARLSDLIAYNFAYAPGATDVDSPIDIALASRQGVCQDFTHIMIALCRRWGVPARYVSGYLLTDREHGDRSAPDASHAWLEILTPRVGWIGYDPTNRRLAGEGHVAVAIGRDYADVPPVKGVFKGLAGSAVAVEVEVSLTDRIGETAGRPRLAPRPVIRPKPVVTVDPIAQAAQQQQQ